jgi:hypothetical protein
LAHRGKHRSEARSFLIKIKETTAPLAAVQEQRAAVYQAEVDLPRAIGSLIVKSAPPDD